MENRQAGAMFDQVANNIRNNMETINKQLENCEIQSVVASQEEQIVNFLSLDGEQLVLDQEKTDYYDLNMVSKIFEMLGGSKTETKKKLKTQRSDSVPSLASSTLASSIMSAPSFDDVSVVPELSSDVASHLAEIRRVVESIKNSSIGVIDLGPFAAKAKSANEKLNSLMHSIKKLLKDLETVASSDTFVQNIETPTINSKLIEDLQKLAQVNFSYSNRIK